MNNSKKSRTITPKNIGSFIIYCLPCLVAMGAILYFYYSRTQKVSEQLTDIGKSFQSYVIEKSVLDSLKSHSVPDTILGKLKTLVVQGKSKDFAKTLEDSIGNTQYNSLILKFMEFVQKPPKLPPEGANEVEKKLDDFFRKQKPGNLRSKINEIDERVTAIWSRNSAIIFLFTFLPFLLLGARLAFGNKVGLDEAGRILNEAERFKAARSHLPMKFVVACVITIGWMYVVNPHGRGATTSEEYLNAVNVVTDSTLPVFVQPGEISNTVAGFLGWYLYLLLHFFRKLYYSDVVSSRVYRFLFGKFLFTYGIALTFSAVLVNEAKPALFLIGFFSLSAVSILKQYGLKAANALAESKVNLSELPGISVWHVMRLEEEGVDSTSTLANYDLDKLKLLPRVMHPLVEFWRNIAQLQTILGKESYEKIKGFSLTAKEFIRKVEEKNNADFIQGINTEGVKNSLEVVELLKTFRNQPDNKSGEKKK